MEEKKQQIAALPKTYHDGYTEGWDAAMKAYRQPGAVWVRASVRLPNNPGDPFNHFRLHGRKVNGNFYQDSDGMMFFEVRGSTHEPYQIGWKSFQYLEWLDESPAEQPVVDNQDWSNFIPQMSNIQDRTGISIEWQKVWAEVENWYGDIKKKETGEQFLKRMQATYFTKTAAAGREEDAVEFAEWIKKNSYEVKFSDQGKLWVDYRLDRNNSYTTAQLYELFKQQKEK